MLVQLTYIIEAFYEFLRYHNPGYSKEHFIPSLKPCPPHAGEIWKRRFLSKRYQVFFAHNPSKSFENSAITGHFGVVIKENSGEKGKSRDCRDAVAL